jgi:hypothetical protein
VTQEKLKPRSEGEHTKHTYQPPTHMSDDEKTEAAERKQDALEDKNPVKEEAILDAPF